MNKIKLTKLIGNKMHADKISANKLSTGTGLNSYQIKKVIEGTAADGVYLKVCDYLDITIPEDEPVPIKGTALVKPVGPDRYIVTMKKNGIEKVEIMHKADVDELADNYTVEYEAVKKVEEVKEEPIEEPIEDITKPILTDDDPMLEMTKELWVDGKKYTEDTIRIMVESAVSEHREHVVLMDQVTCLQNKLDELEERYTARDKEAIRLQVQVEELTEQLHERTESVTIESMTIGESIKMYRTLKKLFKDEVLQ